MRVARRRLNLRYEYSLLSALKGNYLRFCSLYRELQLEAHPAVYIHRSGFEKFNSVVLPFA